MSTKSTLFKDYYSTLSTRKQFKRRMDYLYENFVFDKSEISIIQFINLINNYYYKYAGSLYALNANLKPFYVEFLSSLEPGFDIVDIGGGTGFTYNVIKEIGYSYNRYYFVEPSTYMRDRLNVEDAKLTIISDYIENCWGRLKSSGSKKIYIMNAALHHIIYLEQFAEGLRNAMNNDDIFFIPYEPNNGYQYSMVAIVYNAIKAVKNPRIIARWVLRNLGLFDLFRKCKPRHSSNETKHLTMTLNDLIKDRIVLPEFNEQMIYAITDYGVFDNWKAIRIPDDYNEGFYTLENLDKILGLHVVYLRTYTFQCHSDSNPYKFRQLIDVVARKMFRTSGAKLCMAFKK